MSSCEKHYVNVTRVGVNQTSLASVFADTPDPRLKSPPKGEQLIVEWNLASHVEGRLLFLELSVIFQDHTEEVIQYSLDHTRGIISYFLLGEKYSLKQGIMTYKVEIKESHGEVVKSWQHKLWVKLIPLEGF